MTNSESPDASGTPGSTHTGRPIIRSTADGGVLVLCPYGHLYTHIRRGEWAGSLWEAQLGDPAYTVTCAGRTDPT